MARTYYAEGRQLAKMIQGTLLLIGLKGTDLMRIRQGSDTEQKKAYHEDIYYDEYVPIYVLCTFAG